MFNKGVAMAPTQTPKHVEAHELTARRLRRIKTSPFLQGLFIVLRFFKNNDYRFVMTLEMLVEIFAWVAGMFFLLVLGYITWLWRRLQVKIENSITRLEVEKLIAEKEMSIAKDINTVKEDTRSMANSVVQAVKGLEERFDTLMLHMLNNRGDK